MRSIWRESIAARLPLHAPAMTCEIYSHRFCRDLSAECLWSALSGMLHSFYARLAESQTVDCQADDLKIGHSQEKVEDGNAQQQDGPGER